MSESACPTKNGAVDLRVESIPFHEIPGQTKLFLDFLKSPASLSEYYPTAVSRFEDLAMSAGAVLDAYTTDREAISEILDEQNTNFGCGRETLDNIERLRQADCVAVVTGQQAGLYTGPLYSIYKALTAIRGAARLRDLGVNAVPIFWIATEDHDLDEVSNAFAISKNGELFESKVTSPEAEIGKPVGAIDLPATIADVTNELITMMPSSEFSGELKLQLAETYSAADTFGSSFAKLLTRLLGRFGLIVFDPMSDRAKQLTSELVEQAVARSEEIVAALLERSAKLESAGFHAQVLVEEDYFPLFWIDEKRYRRSLKRTKKGSFRVTGTRREFLVSDLIEIARTKPESLSPGVMLRPVVQDILFPTVCYFGGGAEIAYFAQNSEVYRLLGRRVTPILPRQSFTILETKHERTLNKYGLVFNELFEGIEKLRPRIVEEVIDPETPNVFAAVEENINAELDRLDLQLAKIDPTLVESLEKRRRKVTYHVEALRIKFQRVSIERDETINRQIRSMFQSLMPHAGLQERTLTFASFANKYGPDLVEWIYDSIDLDDTGHKVVHL